MGCDNSRLKNQLKSELGYTFDNFDFRINPSDAFTFRDRAKREHTGGCAPEDYLERIYSAYREFMIDTAADIKLSKLKPENGKFTARHSPGPLIDEMWCLAILYSEKYKELCEKIAGGVIDRPTIQHSNNLSFCKKAWPDYHSEFHLLDEKYVV